MCLQARAQQRESFTVTGKVISAASGVAIEGATVTNKRSRIHAVTDRLGEYRIPARPDDILIFSFVGYVTAEEDVNGREQIIVALESAANTLEEVEINAGYYTTTRRLSTGSISRITAEDIGTQVLTNPLQALQGRVSGVYIQQTSGLPGSQINIEIRGRNSIASGSNPLYIIDGVPFDSETFSNGGEAVIPLVGGASPLSSLDISSIASIEILKDADATAIYGSRGANGVVLITTKKGVAGKAVFDLNIQNGVSEIGRKLKLLNTRQYLDMRYEALRNDGIENYLVERPDLLVDLTQWDTTRYTDWQKVLIGEHARTSQVQTSFAGGTQHIRFRLGGTYLYQGNVYPGKKALNKGGANFSLVYASMDNKLTMSMVANFVTDKNSLPAQDLTHVALRLPPVAPPLFLEDGRLNWANGTWQNPLSYLEETYQANNKNLISNLNITYDFQPWLEFRSNVGYNILNATERKLTPSGYFDFGGDPASVQRSAYFNQGERRYFLTESQLFASKSGKWGKVEALMGGAYQYRVGERTAYSVTGYGNDALMQNPRAGTDFRISGYNYSQYRYAAIFGRFAYNLKNKYLVNITGRRDGSSRFGSGKQFANFGAVGAAWVFSEEAIAQGVGWLNFGKIRASYGVTGNDQIGDYAYLDGYEPSGWYADKAGMAPTRLYNPSYRWETNHKLEFALELGLVKDRIYMSASYYRNRSSNQLIQYKLPATTGFSSILSNLPAVVENTGWEMEFQSTNVKSNQLTWQTSVTISRPRNKLVAFPELESSTYAQTYAIGMPLNISRRYHSGGVDPQSGTYVIKDINGDGRITQLDDRTKFIFIGPDFHGGVQNMFSYGPLSLEIFFQFAKQVGPSYHVFMGQPGNAGNIPTEVWDRRWKQPGQTSEIQRFRTGIVNTALNQTYQQFQTSDAAIVDASYVRLKSLVLAYAIPTTLIRWVDVNVYLQGQNLLTFTRYQGLDPETQSRSLPPLRAITLGLQFSI